MYTNKEFGIQESNLWLAYFGVGGGQKPCQPPFPVVRGVLTGTSFEGWRVISYTTIPAELILYRLYFYFTQFKICLISFVQSSVLDL